MPVLPRLDTLRDWTMQHLMKQEVLPGSLFKAVSQNASVYDDVDALIRDTLPLYQRDVEEAHFDTMNAILPLAFWNLPMHC
jgi:hypothetical protein